MGKEVSGRAVLIGAAPDQGLEWIRDLLNEKDYIICADGGRSKAESFGLRPHWYVGDNDSGGDPAGLPSTLLPSEKDVSDMEMAVDQAFEMGYRHLILTGCTGGRGDHHLANLSLLEEIFHRGGDAVLLDEWNEYRYLGEGCHHIQDTPSYRYFGLIPLDREVKGVSIRGAKYELEKFDLRRGSTRSISNEFAGSSEIEIEICEGSVLLVRTLRKK